MIYIYSPSPVWLSPSGGVGTVWVWHGTWCGTVWHGVRCGTICDITFGYGVIERLGIRYEKSLYVIWYVRGMV